MENNLEIMISQEKIKTKTNRDFMVRINEEIALAQRYDFELSLIFLVPNYSNQKGAANDPYYGVELIRSYGEQLFEAVKLRSYDIVTCFETGVFAILLPCTMITETERVISAVRSQIGELSTQRREAISDIMSFSVGAAKYRRDESALNFLRRVAYAFGSWSQSKYPDKVKNQVLPFSRDDEDRIRLEKDRLADTLLGEMAEKLFNFKSQTNLVHAWDREFSARLGEMTARTERDKQAFTLLVIRGEQAEMVVDINGENYTQCSTDARQAFILKHLRRYDFLGRNSDNHIVIAMPYTNRAEAENVLMRLQRRACDGSQTVDDCAGFLYSFSSQFIEYRSGETTQELMRRAEKAVYRYHDVIDNASAL